MALAVSDVARAGAFYRALFGLEPTKTRARYLRFESNDPPVNLTLNETSNAQAQVDPQHFGIQVKHTATVASARERMETAGFPTRVENQVSCCYAVQDKVWIADPDGHRWEVYVLTDDNAENHAPVPDATSERIGCEPSCCR